MYRVKEIGQQQRNVNAANRALLGDVDDFGGAPPRSKGRGALLGDRATSDRNPITGVPRYSPRQSPSRRPSSADSVRSNSSTGSTRSGASAGSNNSSRGSMQGARAAGSNAGNGGGINAARRAGTPPPRAASNSRAIAAGSNVGSVARPSSAGAGAGARAGGAMVIDARTLAARAMMNINSNSSTTNNTRGSSNNNSTNEIIDRVRARIVQRGGSSGIKGLAKLLAIMDDNGDKRLSKEELK